MKQQAEKLKEELTQKQIEEMKAFEAQALNELVNDKGNAAFLNGAIQKFTNDVKAQNKECEPAAYMMSGAIIGYTLCLINRGGEGIGNS